MANEANRTIHKQQEQKGPEGPRAEREAQEAILRGKAAADEMTETGRRITEDAADITRRSTETVQQTVQSGIEMATQFAERSVDQMAAMAGLPTRQTQEAVQESSRNLQAIFDSGVVLADAVQKLQQELLDIARERQQQNFERYDRLFRSRSLTEFAALQIELARGQVESIVEGSRRASRLIGKAADRALQRMQDEEPVRSRAA